MAFSVCAWMMFGGEPASLGARAYTPVLPADIQGTPPTHVAGQSNVPFASRWTTDGVSHGSAPTPATTGSVATSFGNRFASTSPAPPTRSLRPSSSTSFSDRFGGDAITAARLPAQLILASVPPPTIPPAATSAPAPAPHASARALIARVAPKHQEHPAGATYRVASIGDAPIRTAYAPADAANKDAAFDDSLKKVMPHDPAPKDAAANPDMSHTAVYDITAHAVYLPNGQRLEAHSGLGDHMDDLGSVNLRSLGPTPPGIYDLTMRERSFHGIDAIRLNPVDNGKMYGRDGILAHPYMLGPNGQSNGCVSFKDYNAFLAAFRRGEFNRMVVVERFDDPPGGQTASGWITNKLRGLFGQS